MVADWSSNAEIGGQDGPPDFAAEYENRPLEERLAGFFHPFHPLDWTEEGGQLTPSLKLRRNVVTREFRREIDDLYSR